MSSTPGRDVHWRAADSQLPQSLDQTFQAQTQFLRRLRKTDPKPVIQPTAERITGGRYGGAKGSLALHLRDRKGIAYDFTYDLL